VGRFIGAGVNFGLAAAVAAMGTLGIRSDRAVGGPFNEIRAPKENAMAEHATPATCGVDHVGLSVRDLESTRRFFCDCLGWRVVGERPEYPAVFVSDGQQIVTLWRVEAPDRAVAFDRRTNVGLHHLAFAVADRAGLDPLYERVASWPGVVVEFAPELSGKGPKIHFIVREPSGIRIEFAFDPRVERPR
jgi:catechol 2,3-dioxygenase-like lactoylglutathione lyase family enzyme